jgi:small subunit ribosomal protein S20
MLDMWLRDLIVVPARASTQARTFTRFHPTSNRWARELAGGDRWSSASSFDLASADPSGKIGLTSRACTNKIPCLLVKQAVRFPGEFSLANSTQARKRARQAEQRRRQNTSFRSTMRTSMKKVVKLIETGDKQAAADAYKAAVPIIDSAAGKGLIHQNKAARHKSRLNAHIKAMS